MRKRQPLSIKADIKMKYDHIIWDFNGTILDDVETGITSVNKLLRERGLAEIPSKERYRELFHFPIRDYYEKLGFDFSREPYEVIAPLWVEQYLINVRSAELYDDVIYALEFFKERGVRQTLISATEKNMLLRQLGDLGIAEYFEEIMGLDNIHASSKQSLAEDWKKRHEGERVLFIGDTDHDLSVARSVNSPCALVCRGHQSKEHLSKLSAKVYDTLLQICLDIQG